MADETIIETIDEQVKKLTKSLENDLPMHLRDRRAVLDDGYENYMTMAEDQVLSAIRSEKESAIKSLKLLKMHILAEGTTK